MKEHALFLSVGFLPPGASFAGEGLRFLQQFEKLLARVVALSDGIVCRPVLDSGEVVTPFTACAEEQTQRLTGVRIDGGLTARENGLRPRDETCSGCPPGRSGS